MATPGLGALRIPLLSAQTVDETVSEPVLVLGYKDIAIYTIGTGTITAGSITIETADFNPASAAADLYAGTWSSVATVTASDVSGGKQKHTPLTDSAYTYIRTRIDTALDGGGSISTVLVAV